MAIVHWFFGGDKSFDWKFEVKGKWELPRTCPECRGDLVKHGGYARKTCVPWVGRMLCKACGRTMAVLPHFVAPYQREWTNVREAVVASWTEGPAYGVWPMGSPAA